MSLDEVQKPGVGVLLLNLGTPDAPTPAAVRRYLAEFLSDPRVVEVPRAIWLPILYGFILPFRPRRVAHAYATIWEDGGSPLLTRSVKLAQALRPVLGTAVQVELAMRYGQPSVASALARFEQAGVRRLLVLPLYPQYSGSTTASAMDGVFAQLMKQRCMPELRSVHDYHEDPGYIAALAASVHQHWDRQGRADRLLLSFHGVPQRYVDAGDPYQSQCLRTADRLRQALSLGDGELTVAFQSRFGREPWLQPYTDEMLMQWGREGVGTVDTLCPGFSADCLETLEEIAIRNREDFIAAGGKDLCYIPALNDSPEHVAALGDILRTALQGWM